MKYLVPAALILCVVLISIKRTRIIGKAFFSFLLCLAALPFLLVIYIQIAFTAPEQLWTMVPITIATAGILYCILLFIWRKKHVKLHYISAASVILVCALVVGGAFWYRAYVESIPTISDGGSEIYKYHPYLENNELIKLDEPSTLRITSDFPSLDGATAFYPIYAAFANAIYPSHVLGDYKVLTCSKTGEAYRRLIDGEVDMIFVFEPSEAQKAAAKEAGVELIFTPIGREAFVFFVNSENPTNGLTLDQIRGIYSGNITHWSEVGVSSLGMIRAFQRDEGSGSQTALQSLMAGYELMQPTEKEVVYGMEGIIKRTADYKNYKNAIGFSFRFYATQMVSDNQIRLLKIDGIAPTRENILNGTYPLCYDFYAVTTKNSNPRSAEIIEWILSEQGQHIIEKTGYVGIGGR